MDEMRIDKFLKVSRILKRRTVAQEACAGGKVCVNGRAAKPSHCVKAGDVVEITYATGTLKFKVLNIKQTTKKDEAARSRRALRDTVTPYGSAARRRQMN